VGLKTINVNEARGNTRIAKGTYRLTMFHEMTQMKELNPVPVRLENDSNERT
jgi:hypothetical protein